MKLTLPFLLLSCESIILLLHNNNNFVLHALTPSPPILRTRSTNTNVAFVGLYFKQQQQQKQQQHAYYYNSRRYKYRSTTTITTTTTTTTTTTLTIKQSSSSSSNNSNNNFDYEYIPPRTAEDGRRLLDISQSSSSSSSLTSTYPPNTPAGLRGEAIRSALRTSSKCIGYNFQNTIYECGIIQVISTTSTEDDNDTKSSSSNSLYTFLNGKFTQYISPVSKPLQLSSTQSSSSSSLYTESSFLNSKGQLIDLISIAIPNTTSSSHNNNNNNNKAYLVTSPGHTSSSLYQQLNPYIFPFDQIQLVQPSSASSICMFHLVSSKLRVIQDCYTKYILSQLPLSNIQQEQYHKTLPPPGQCVEISFVVVVVVVEDNEQIQQPMTLLILPAAIGLPSCAGYGYTFCFFYNNDSDTTTTTTTAPTITAATTFQTKSSSSSSQKHIGHTIWEYIISESCYDGPIEIGTLEYDTLRIECGQSLYNHEITATITKQHKSGSTKSTSTSSSSSSSSTIVGTGMTPASPFELGLDYTIVDTITSKLKGCYLGQEGIASILKNPRGPPRTLYQVIFDDESNIYDYQSDGEYISKKGNNGDKVNNNLTRTPMPNDTLYVLGSNEEIVVGRITSVAEPSGTGEPITIALALVRRADIIQLSMKQRGIDLPNVVMPPNLNNDRNDNYNDNDISGSILIPPPPIDVLDGLEVIIGGTYTIGTLRMIPSRRLRNKFLFSEDDIPSYVQNLPSEQDMYDLLPLTQFPKGTNDNGNNINNNGYETTQQSSSSSTSTTNIRNAEIITDVPFVDNRDADDEEEQEELERAIQEADEAAKEAERKAAKLELLRQRAEEAMARRKQKQQQEEQ